METKYFASANSYNGFCSFFEDIFNSRDFDNVFVLKGGPGTGKSTFMKKADEFAKSKGGRTKLYYCSSDVDSLDGIIINMGEKRFAIIDGTSPHERDAIFAGVTDEIVDLGESIDQEWIRLQKDDVISLSEQKSKAYKTAYSYLRIAGVCHDEICKKKLSRFDTYSASKFIRNFPIISDSIMNKSKKTFASSFSKVGYKAFKIPNDSYNVSIKILGDQTNSKILLKFIKNKLDCKKTETFHYPLDPAFPEALIIDGCLISESGDDSDLISSDEYFTTTKTDKEEIRLVTKIHDDSLEEAARWLSIASDIHFRLENIYSKCMKFENNEVIFDKICKKILKVCECND